jgi:hypothetical protein
MIKTGTLLYSFLAGIFLVLPEIACFSVYHAGYSPAMPSNK